MLCSHCQTPLQEGAKFCHKCGQTTQPTSHAQEQSVASSAAHPPTGVPVATALPSICPKCQQQPKPGLKFCNHCGWSLSTPVPEVRRKKRRRKSSSHTERQGTTGRVAAAVVVALLLALVGAYFAWTGQSKSAMAGSVPLTTEQALATAVYVDGKPSGPTASATPQILIPVPPQPAAAPPVPRWDPSEVVLEPEEVQTPAVEPHAVETKPKPKSRPKPPPAPAPPEPMAVPEPVVPTPLPAPEIHVRPCSEAVLLMRPVCLVEGAQTFWKCTPDGKRWDNQIPGCRRSDEH